ncbi:hypothetical protein [Sinorhizobium sp. BJ1]|uniref:hypothetical protein n=1 Tax=Sinorhizobium sp. BJ1 TaxID=2035455 RepID=UPI000BE871B5|nr:hypothetical protein [Sinorhizobium sp. BJ1]PDT80588.1 hypothetical protein CO676_26670 [Sinorhizobium sp. BJ1]
MTVYPNGTVAIETLGDMLDDGYRFNVWCLKCKRGRLLPVQPFVDKLGRDHELYVADHIKCSKCGGKNIELRLQAPGPKP